jgi:peptidoglycan/xylan/chitin deacetylase (PgdA/CDA1 family)
MLKPILKRQAQTLAAGIAPMLWQFRREQLPILMYHRILPADDVRAASEQPGMIVHPETLRLQLRTLKRHFEIVSLEDWVERATTGRTLPDRACAITFDDGWRDNYEHAYPALVDEQVPATIFIVSGMVGTDQSFWPERLADLLRHGISRYGKALFELPAFNWLYALEVPLPSTTDDLSRERLDAFIVQAKRFPDTDIHERLAHMADILTLNEYQHDLALADWDQLAEMVEGGFVNIGSHTRRHVRLTSEVHTDTLENEIVGSKTEIEKRLGRSVRLFCYPNGDYSPEARALVARHYLGACSTIHGWHRRTADLHTMHRIGVHQDISYDETSFLARLSGWL